jgi:cell division protein FtsB
MLSPAAVVNAALSDRPHGCRMVTRKRVRSILTALGLYVIAALLIGYFGMNAFSGNRGIKAKQDIDQQVGELSTELARLKLERSQWERRIALLKSSGLDPDMLDERARALLDYSHPHDLTLMVTEPPHRGP